MLRLSRFFTPASLLAGAALVAYGGYGAGVGQTAAAGVSHWLQVAAVAGSGAGLLGTGLWRGRLATDRPSASFAADLAALERLIPTLRTHPDGLGALQDLIDVLFEACHRPEATRVSRPTVERTPKGGRTDD